MSVARTVVGFGELTFELVPELGAAAVRLVARRRGRGGD